MPSPNSADIQKFNLVLWVAMVSSIALYFLVANLVQVPQAQDNPELVIGMMICAVLLAGGSLPVRMQFGQEDPRRGLIIALVMCEAAAIFGLLVRFAAGSPYYYVFFLIGLAGMALHFPKQST